MIKKYKEPNMPIKYRTVKEANEALRDYADKYKGYYFINQDDNDPYRNGSVPNELYNSWKWNESIYHSNDPIELQYINRDMDYRKQQIDERFNKYFENGKIANLPTITKYGTPHLQVITYPFAGESYPYSSHSEVRGPNLLVSRKMHDSNYNFLFNNCSDSTYRFLDDVLGNEFDGSNSTWRPIMTPFIVEQLAKKVPGAKTIKEPDGLRDATITYIPLTKERMPAYKNAVAKGAEYYESLKKQGGKLISRKFQSGGNLNNEEELNAEITRLLGQHLYERFAEQNNIDLNIATSPEYNERFQKFYESIPEDDLINTINLLKGEAQNRLYHRNQNNNSQVNENTVTPQLEKQTTIQPSLNEKPTLVGKNTWLHWWLPQRKEQFEQNKLAAGSDETIESQLNRLANTELYTKKVPEDSLNPTDTFPHVYIRKPDFETQIPYVYLPYTDDSTDVHEFTHALKRSGTLSPQEIAIAKIMEDLDDNEKSNSDNRDTYYTSPSELYAALNQFRKDNNISPDKVFKEDDNLDSYTWSRQVRDRLGRISRKKLIQMLNEVAYNLPQRKLNDISYAKQGRKLIPRKFQFGGVPILTLPDQTVYVGPKGGKSRVDVENEAMWKKAEPYYRELVAAGINPYVAVGVLGNIALESAFDPNANHHGKYHGLTQNQTDAKNWIIKNYGGYSKAHQMRFLVDGLMGKLQDSNKIPWQREFFKRFAGFNKATRNLRNIDAITDAWEKHYERSGGQGSPIRRRYANYFAKVLGLIN